MLGALNALAPANVVKAELKFIIPLLSALALLSFFSAPAGAEDAGPSAVATYAGGCFWCMETPFE